MPEQLALHQRLGNRRAVDRHVSRVAPRRQLVNRPRHQLLAGAALSRYHHRRRRLRQPLDSRDHLAHRQRTSEQGSQLASLGQAPAQGRVLFADINIVGDVFEYSLQMGWIDRLAQVINRALLERFHCVGYLALPRNHDGRQMDTKLADIVQQLEAALAGHPQVRKQDMRVEAADELERPDPVLGNLAAKSPHRKRLAPLFVGVDVIFRDQDTNFICHNFSRRNAANLRFVPKHCNNHAQPLTSPKYYDLYKIFAQNPLRIADQSVTFTL